MLLTATSDKEGFTFTGIGPELTPETTYDARFTFSHNRNSFAGGNRGGTAYAVPSEGSDDGQATGTFNYSLARISTPGFVKAWFEAEGSDPAHPKPIGEMELVFAVAP